MDTDKPTDSATTQPDIDTTKPPIREGQRWRLVNGDEVVIRGNDGSARWPWSTDNGEWYGNDGTFWDDGRSSPKDLPDLLSDAPAQPDDTLVALNARIDALSVRLSALEAAQQAVTEESSAAQDDDPQTLHTVALKMVDTLERLQVLPEADAELAQPEAAAPTDEKLTLTYACAQAVLDVYWKNVGMPSALAKELGFTNAPLVAALRSAAGCVPKENWGGENYATGFRDGIAFGCQFLHELAAELEGD